MSPARCLQDVAVLVLCCTPIAGAQIVFGPPVNAVTSVQHGYDVATADLDGDGFVDLAVGTSPDHEARLFFGDGRGHFGPALPTTPAIDATAIGLGDLDGDGHPELLTAPYSPGQPLELHVWKGLGGAAFSGPVSYPLAGDLPSSSGGFSITVDDADGDADPDVVVRVASILGPQFEGGLTVLLNDGSGALTPQVIVNDSAIFGAEVADLDADGLPDAVYTTVAVIFVFPVFTTHLALGQPGGGFVEAHAWPNLNLLGLADLDQDGLLDLVTFTDTAWSTLIVHLGLGGAAFADQPPFPLPSGFARALADFDGDAIADLLFTHVTGVIYPTWAVWPGDGRGGFDASRVSYTNRPGIEPREFLLAADAVADGRLDIIDEGAPAAGMQLSTIPNWTYPAVSAQLDLGHAQFGGDGWPGTLFTGDFGPDEPVTVELWAAGVHTPAFLVVGLSESFAPFKGGVMVPEPDLVIGPVSTGTELILGFEGRWPRGLPVGTAITFQWWMTDPLAPQGLSASTAVRVTQP